MLEEFADSEGAMQSPRRYEDEMDPKKLRPPNKKKFDEEIDLLHVQIRDKEAELEKSKQAGSVVSQLKSLKAEKIATIERRKKIDVDLEKLNKEIPVKMRQLNETESSLIYKNEDRINTAIQRLEWNLRAQSYKLSEEKKIVSEIDRLKRSKKTLGQYLTLKQEVAGIRDRQRRMREERDTYFREVTNLKAKETTLQKNSIQARTSFATVKKELDELYERKRSLVAEYRKDREEFMEVKDKMKKESWKKKEEERRAFVAEKRKEKAEQVIEKLPYEKDLQVCNTLIQYLGRFVQNIPEQPDSFSPSSSQDDPEQEPGEIEDGQFKLLKKTSDLEGLDYSVASRKLSKKNKRFRKQSMIKKITHTPEVLSHFLSLDMTPPSLLSDVTTALAHLNIKKAHYEKEQLASEDESETSVSVTESALCEMSRQASKTESCEETHPGDQVIAELMKASKEEDDHQEGAVGPEVLGSTASESSESNSPNSESTIDNDTPICTESSFASPKLIDTLPLDVEPVKFSYNQALKRNLSKFTGTDNTVVMHDEVFPQENLFAGGDSRITHTSITPERSGKFEYLTHEDAKMTKKSLFRIAEKDTPSPKGNDSESAHINTVVDSLSNIKIHVSEPDQTETHALEAEKVEYKLENTSSNDNKGPHLLSYAGSVLKPRPRSLSEAKSYPLTLPDKTRPDRAGNSKIIPALLSPRFPPDSKNPKLDLKLDSKEKFSKSKPKSSSSSLSNSSPASSTTHKQLSQRYSSPPNFQGEPLLTFDSEDFPPLSSFSRRSSNLSLKSSGESSDTLVSPGDSLNQSTWVSALGKQSAFMTSISSTTTTITTSNTTPSSFPRAASSLNPTDIPESTLAISAIINNNIKTEIKGQGSSITVSELPGQDELSTEKWVESVVNLSQSQTDGDSEPLTASTELSADSKPGTL